jgi:hypothetical protein
MTENHERQTGPPADIDKPNEPVVTEAPSSHQARNAPPPGSEPQGRTTMIAAVAAIVVIILVVAIVFLL